MAGYRIYMIEERGKRKSANEANCPSDEEALSLAQCMISKPRATAEVWCGERLVAVVSLKSTVEVNGFALPGGPPRSGS